MRHPHLLRRPILVFLVALGILGRAAAEEQERLMLHPKVNGQRMNMAFDTGANDFVLFPAAATRLGLKFSTPPKPAKVPLGEVPFGVSEATDFQLSRTKTRVRFVVYDPPAIANTTLDGVVGWGRLRENSFEIDARKLKVTWRKGIPQLSPEWSMWPIDPKSDVLVLQLPTAGGRPESVLVDTGMSDGATLSPARWKSWMAAHPDAPITLNAYFTPALGLVVAKVAWADELSIGGLTLRDVPVIEPPKEIAALKMPTTQATFGLAALKRLDFMVDGKKSVAYLRARTDAAQPYDHNRMGAVFVPVSVDHDELKAHVIEHSPAWQAGIRDGDQLLRINEVDMTQWRTNLATLSREKFSNKPAGTKLKLSLKRNNEVITANVVLRDIIGPGQ